MFAVAEDAGDLGIGFALGNPEQNFGFARGEFEGGAQRLEGTEVRIEPRAFDGGVLRWRGGAAIEQAMSSKPSVLGTVKGTWVAVWRRSSPLPDGCIAASAWL